MVKHKAGLNRDFIILARVSVLSRLTIFILQVVFNAIPDHDADAFKPANTDVNQGFLDSVVQNGLDGYSKWDAKYFLHIARNGYEEERMFAFFPLFPMLLRYSARTVEMLLPLSFHSCLLLCGALLNMFFFIGATNALYKLTYTIYRRQNFAFLVATLFCFNPASIFFSSNYTESLYCFLVFEGLNQLENGQQFRSALWFLAGSSTRSNGIVNAGFILYRTAKRWIPTLVGGRSDRDGALISGIITDLLSCLLACLATVLPFILFNVHGHYKFCQADEAAEWCSRHMLSLYSYVQAQYWDVGFLNYFKLIKLPNFLLAMPCQLLIAYGALCYLVARKDQMWSLGFLDRCPSRTVAQWWSLVAASQNVFVYMAHAVFLLLFSFFFMHVEVTTRFIMSSSPFPYWIAASLIFKDLTTRDLCARTVNEVLHIWRYTHLSGASRAVLVYFVAYLVVGTLLHVNYLPWT